MAGPGAYCWGEVFTREPEKSDAFLPAVFSCRSERFEDQDQPDFRIHGLGERSVPGRMDTPFGRCAALGDPQGAHLSVIDITATTGEVPTTTDVD